MIAQLTLVRHDAVKKASKKAARKSPGRPSVPESERLEKGMTLRFNAEHRDLVRRAAERAGMPETVFGRDAVLKEARRLLGE